MAGRDSRVTVTAPFQPYTIGLGHRSTSQRAAERPMFLYEPAGATTIASPKAEMLRAVVPQRQCARYSGVSAPLARAL